MPTLEGLGLEVVCADLTRPRQKLRGNGFLNISMSHFALRARCRLRAQTSEQESKARMLPFKVPHLQSSPCPSACSLCLSEFVRVRVCVGQEENCAKGQGDIRRKAGAKRPDPGSCAVFSLRAKGVERSLVPAINAWLLVDYSAATRQGAPNGVYSNHGFGVPC